MGIVVVVYVLCDSRNRICDVILLWFLVWNALQTTRNFLFLHSWFKSEITSVCSCRCSYIRQCSDSQWTAVCKNAEVAMANIFRQQAWANINPVGAEQCCERYVLSIVWMFLYWSCYCHLLLLETWREKYVGYWAEVCMCLLDDDDCGGGGNDDDDDDNNNNNLICAGLWGAVDIRR